MYLGLFHLGEELKMMASKALLPGIITCMIQEVVQILPLVLGVGDHQSEPDVTDTEKPIKET